MKKTIITLTLISAIFLIPATQSCQKYEEGPMVSLRSKTERVANTWAVDNYKINGKDYTSLLTNYIETYSMKGAYNYTWGIIHGSGSWIFQKNFEEIKVTNSDSSDYKVLSILKLEENSFWYSYTDGGDKHELHLISK